MEFNSDKCRVMHIDKKSLNSEFALIITTLQSTDSDRDLGLLVDKSFKLSEHCNKAANSANVVIRDD